MSRIKARKNQRHRDEQSGFVVIEFVAGLVLLIMPAAILVLTLPVWWERVSMAKVASREAARAYVISGDADAAKQSVLDIASHYDVTAGDTSLTSLTGDRTRGSVVVATVHTTIPAVHLPIFNFDVGTININETHSEPVDLYRSFG